MNLIIDGKNLGPVKGYRQNRQLLRWVFLMEAGYYIGIDLSSVKSFTSCGELNITTFEEAKE